MNLLRPRRPAPSVGDSKSEAFSPADVARFRARGGDSHVVVRLALELECATCSKFFPSRALALVPIGYGENELGPFSLLQVTSRICSDCEDPR